MKKITITTLLLAIFVCSQAQEAAKESKTSKFVLGGNIALEYSQSAFESNYGIDTKLSTSSLISIAPYVGYKTGARWMIGLKIGYTYFDDYYDRPRKLFSTSSLDYIVRAVKGNEISFAPFLRFSSTIGAGKLGYYFDVNTGIKIPLDMKAEWGYDYRTPYGPYDYIGYFVGSDFGLLYNFTAKIGVEFAVSFLQIEYTDEELRRMPGLENSDEIWKNKTFEIKFLPELFKPNIGINIKL